MQTLSVGARVTGVSAILCACQPSFPPTTTRRDLPAAAARICACGYSLPPGQHRLANRRRVEMAGKHDAEKLKTLASVSTERRKLIGQAIIDGLISPGESAFSPVAADPDYNQGQGGYTQKGGDHKQGGGRSEEHTSELQSLMRISYAVFCLQNTILQHYQISFFIYYFS